VSLDEEEIPLVIETQIHVVLKPQTTPEQVQSTTEIIKGLKIKALEAHRRGDSGLALDLMKRAKDIASRSNESSQTIDKKSSGPVQGSSKPKIISSSNTQSVNQSVKPSAPVSSAPITKPVSVSSPSIEQQINLLKKKALTAFTAGDKTLALELIKQGKSLAKSLENHPTQKPSSFSGYSPSTTQVSLVDEKSTQCLSTAPKQLAKPEFNKTSPSTSQNPPPIASPAVSPDTTAQKIGTLKKLAIQAHKSGNKPHPSSQKWK